MLGWLIFGIVVVLLFLILILPGFRLIGPNQVGILTRKMLGKEMPEGQIIARQGEVGILARTLMPGLYWRLPIVWSIAKAPVIEIDVESVGLVEAIEATRDFLGPQPQPAFVRLVDQAREVGQ